MINSYSEKNIVLIGMPGTGKTTVGTQLAQLVSYSFIDTDHLITERTGKTPRQLVEEVGREFFLQAQDEAVLSINNYRCVIATGGGLVHSEVAMNHLKSRGIVIYLNTSFETIENRMDINRKLVRNGGTLRDLYNDRTPLYQKYADFSVICDGNEPKDICKTILNELKNY